MAELDQPATPPTNPAQDGGRFSDDTDSAVGDNM